MDYDTVDQRIKHRLSDLVQAARALDDGDFSRVVSRARTLRRRRQVFGAAVAAAVGAIAVGTVVRDRDPAPVVDAGPTPTTVEVPVSLDPSGEALPEAPLDARAHAAVVWTGSEVVVWGGHVEAANMGFPGDDRSYADGAAYEPSTGRWRPMSDGPLPSSFAPPKGVRVDGGVVLVRGTATALWDPRQDSWRSLGDAPAAVEDLVSTGDGALSYSANARLSVDTGEWTPLPEPPERLGRPSVAWTGSDLVVVGGSGTPFTTPKAVIYNVNTSEWRTSSPAPEGMTAAALAARWDGRRIVVVDYEMYAATYDPQADSWSDLPPVPARFSEHYPSLGEAPPGVSMAFMAQAVVVLTTRDNWVPLPHSSVPDGTQVITGSGVTFVWSLDYEAQRNVLAAFDPTALAQSPSSLQVGIAAIRVPEGFRMAGASVIGQATAIEGVRVELTDGSRSCSVTSTYFGIDGPNLDQPGEETLGDSPGALWRHSRDERTWQTAATDSDRFQIECDDPQAARVLAESTVPPG